MQRIDVGFSSQRNRCGQAPQCPCDLRRGDGAEDLGRLDA